MTWWAMAAPVAMAIVFVMLPGLVLAYAARLRGITAWGIAPAISMSVYAVVGTAYGVVHFAWNAATAGLGAVVLVMALGTGGWWLTRKSRAAEGDSRPVLVSGLAAVALALVTVGIRFAASFGRPDNISQTFDANFHLNGVRYIIDTGDVNPLTFGDLQYAYHGYGSAYPNLWHMVASLVAEASGASIPVAVNAFSIVVGGVVWPLAIVFFTRQLLGARPISLLISGALSACFAAFPLLLIDFGVLYPNFLGYSLIPAAFGTLLVGLGRSRGRTMPRSMAWAALIVVLPGIALAHPNALVSLMVLSVPILIACAGGWFRSARRRGTASAKYWIVGLASFAVAVVFVSVFIKVRPAQAAASWPPTVGPRRAIFNVLANDELGAPAIAISLLILAGVIATIVTRRHIWMIATWLIVGGLYVAVVWLPVGSLRYWITGTWYSDHNRLIALAPVVLVPFATIGTVWLGGLLAAWWKGGFRRLDHSATSRSVAVVTLAVAIVAFVGAQFGPAMSRETGFAMKSYRLDPRSPLLTADERELIERLPNEVPANAMIAGDPWTGTALAWALADRRVVAPHIYSTWPSGGALILESLRTARHGSAVCDAVNALGVKYVLDFGTRGVFGRTDQYPGVHHLATSRAVERVDEQGRAGLYRITACS